MTEASPCHIRDTLVMTDSRDFFIRHGFKYSDLSLFLWDNDIETIEQLSTLSPAQVTLLAIRMKLDVERQHDFRFLIWWVTSEVKKAQGEGKKFQWTREIETHKDYARTEYDDHLMTNPNEFFHIHGIAEFWLQWLLNRRDIKTIEQLSTLSPEDVSQLAIHMELNVEKKQYFRFLIWWVTSEVQKAKDEGKTFRWTPAMDAQENDARIEYEELRLQKLDQIIQSNTPMMIQNPYLVQLAL